MPIEHKKITVEGFDLTYKDLFVFKGVYRVLHKYFCENGWEDRHGYKAEEAKFYENFYLHRETGGGFYDITVDWTWYKYYVNKQYKMCISLQFLLLGGKIEERRMGDRKVKGESGELNVFIKPHVEVSNEAKFDKNPFLRRVKRRFFEKDTRRVAEEVQSYAYSKTKEVYDLLKSYLDTHGSVFGMDTLIHRKWEGV